MKPKHTPGPWCYFDLGERRKFSIVHNGPICYIGDNGNGPDNTEANARLIAAAPELLSVVEGMLAGHELGLWQTTNGTDAEVLRNIVDAIQKAIGE